MKKIKVTSVIIKMKFEEFFNRPVRNIVYNIPFGRYEMEDKQRCPLAVSDYFAEGHLGIYNHLPWAKKYARDSRPWRIA